LRKKKKLGFVEKEKEKIRASWLDSCGMGKTKITLLPAKVWDNF
jgi:hypothetical protein